MTIHIVLHSSTDMPPSRNCRSKPAIAASPYGRNRRRARRAAAASDRRTARGRSRRCVAARATGCGQRIDLVGEADALDLARRLRQQSGSSERSSRSMLEMARLVRADGPIARFQHAHVRHQLDMLEGPGDARFTTSCGGTLSMFSPSTLMVPADEVSTP